MKFLHTRSSAWLLSALLALAFSGCSQTSSSDALSSAKSSIKQRDLRGAAVTLKAALQNDPESAQLRFLLGSVLLVGGDAPAAVVELRKALELGHDEAEAVPEIVKALTASGRAAEATTRFAQTQLRDPRAMADLQIALAAAWSAQGRDDLMRKGVDRALELNPKSASAMLSRARLLAIAGDFEAAQEVNDQVLRLEPRNPLALQMRGRVQRYLKGDIPAAMASQRAALEVDPKLLEAHSELLGMMFEARDREGMRKQMAAMQKALPQNLNTFLFRAQIEYLDNNVRGARELVQQLLRARRPDPRVLILAARLELRDGAPTLSETYLRRALTDNPGLVQAREMLTVTYMRLGQGTQAATTVQPLVDAERPAPAHLALAGEVHLMSGQPAKAQALFERAAKIAPPDARLSTAMAMARIGLGREAEGLAELSRISGTDRGTVADLALVSAHLSRNQWARALAAVDRLDQKAPGRAQFAQLRGQIQLQAKNLPAARAAFNRALELDPTQFPAAMALANIDAAENKPADAKRRFETMLAKDPKNWRALIALAEARARNGDSESEVLTPLQEAVNSHPTVAEPLLALVEYHLRAGAHDQALAAAQKGMAVVPDTPTLLDALGRAQLGKREYQQAISSFRKMASLAPQSPVPHLRIADVHIARGERDAARASLQRALEADPSLISAQARQVQLLLADKQFGDALSIAKQVQRAHSTQYMGYRLEADVLLAQRRWEPALAALRAAAARSPDTDTTIRLHTVLLELGKKSESESIAHGWLSLYPKDRLFLSYLAATAGRMKDWARAEKLYREIIALQAKDAVANNDLAWALMNQGKPGALQFAETANRSAPNTPALMDTLAMAMADAGQVDKALELQKKVVDMAPQLMEAKLNLARIAIKSGNKALARSELEKLTYEGDKFPLQAEVQQLLRSIQ